MTEPQAQQKPWASLWSPPREVTSDPTRAPSTHTSFRFEAELVGGHVHVKVRAASRIPSVQVDHSRGLCGKLIMAPREWALLRAVLMGAEVPEPIWMLEGGSGVLAAPAGSVSYHDGQRFLEFEGWPNAGVARPINARLHRAREHMETAHGAAPEDYGNDVLGWHRANHPECEVSVFV